MNFCECSEGVAQALDRRSVIQAYTFGDGSKKVRRWKKKTRYNSDGLRQWIHITENDGELQSFGRLVAVERRNDHSCASMCTYFLFYTFAEQRLHEHHYHQPQLPPDYPQENPRFNRRKFQFEFENGEVMRLKLYEHLKA